MMTFDEFKLYIYNDKQKFEELKKNVKDKCQADDAIIDMQVTSACTTRERDKHEGLGHFNSIGGSSLRVGSVKVSTISLGRIAYESENNEKKYLQILRDRVIIDLEMLHVLRHIIQRNVEKGLLPNFQEGIIDFKHLYNTVGINGIYETMRVFGYTTVDDFGYTYYTDDAMRFGKSIFDTIHAAIQEFTADKDYMGNVEQVPGETAAVKFLEADKLLYGNVTCVVNTLETVTTFEIGDQKYSIPNSIELKLLDGTKSTITEILEHEYDINESELESFKI